MKIELFTSEGCANCRKLKKILHNLLPELGLIYEEAVEERDVSKTDVLADLIMLNTEVIPTLNIYNKKLIGELATDEKTLRAFLVTNLNLIKS